MVKIIPCECINLGIDDVVIKIKIKNLISICETWLENIWE
jgi:hypothetical protein